MRLSIVVPADAPFDQQAGPAADLEANLRLMADLGYDGVELSVRDPSVLEVDALSQTLDSLGLAVPAISTGRAFTEEGLSFTHPSADVRQAAVERICAQVPLAARWGALVIVGLIRGTAAPGVPEDATRGRLVEALRQCALAADAAAVSVVVEPINRYETALVNTVAEGLALLDEVGAANVGLHLDTFHMNIEEPSIEDSIRLAGPRALHVHVADSNRHYPGAGHLDFRSILQSLKEAGYQGVLSGEFLPLPDAGTAAERGVRFLRRLE